MARTKRFPRWEEKDDARLLRRFDEGAGVEKLATELERSEEDVRARLSLWLPGWDGSAPQPPRYEEIDGLRLRVLDADTYEYQAEGVDYHIQRDEEGWRVDVFDSAIRDDNDAAHLGADERPTLQELLHDLKAGMLDVRMPTGAAHACAHPHCTRRGTSETMRRIGRAWYCPAHAPTLRALLERARTHTKSLRLLHDLDLALDLHTEREAAFQQVVDALHAMRLMAERLDLDERADEAEECLPELGAAERALQQAARQGVAPTATRASDGGA